ncbi:amidohydrolase family protein [Hellea sp.]|nr:amidohydrolase family protein [Hellea sp.]MDA9931857.1 amidohydrolase family protein [bacterium]MDA8888717.1 amidohydrolase family protein [Hellea sp.]MDB4844429.1 amidohydrolase family protein [Hellea sp.]MDC0421826.1 amidohydrolase family protein [Hellea sp.]MDC0651158.1 amidohydrolase family protein [Hellea sp.]
MLIDCDLYIKNGLMFDGSGEYPVINDIAISKGLVVAIGKNLKVAKNVDTIDASNEWVMPGLLDIHTHYDLEIEVSPGLKESIRHGTTTVVMSNCSLGLAFGSQRKDNDDPIVSCFARVENIPKHVLKKVADKVYWSSSSEYIKHLNKLKLGPNVVPMIPHSMLRIEVMGLKDSVSRNPTSKELGKMKSLLKQGLDEGYVGFSTDSLPFHFLANDPNRNKQIPTQFAPFSELKSLTSIVRDYDRVWQATPPKDNPFKVVRAFLLTSGRLYKKPLKTTVVAALDIKSNGSIIKLARTLARILNSKLIGGKFYMQALGAPFKIWSDGLFNPLSEEIDEMRELIETDLDDRQARVLILENEDFRKRFKKMWMKGKVGLNLARLKRLINREDYAFNRNLGDMFIDRCPISRWIGLSFQEVYDDVKAGNVPVGFESIKDEPDFILAMLKVFDTDLVWNTTSANRDPYQTRKLLMDPLLLPGFNDSGAHLTNMAFYDCNLRSLNIAQEGGILDVSYMVKRLTRDAANIFGIAGGQIKVGERADITIVNPEELEVYDGENSVQRIYREDFEHEQLVNRSDGVVTATIVSGRAIWQNSKFANDINKSKYGKCLLAS